MKDNNVLTTYKELVKDAINDLKTKGKRHKQIPNILTLMRLTAPCFIIPATIIGNVPAVVGLTALFGLTDLADGVIARHWKLTSELGKALDAVTDKVFASTLLLAASFSNPMLLCNLCLETAIAGINVSKKLNGEEVASTYIGKTKTWFLFALAGAGIVSQHWNLQSILSPLMISTTIMQTLTLASYLVPTSNNTNTNATNNDETKTNLIEETVETKEQKEKEKILEKDEQPITKQNDKKAELKQLRTIRKELSTFVTSEITQEKTDTTEIGVQKKIGSMDKKAH